MKKLFVLLILLSGLTNAKAQSQSLELKPTQRLRLLSERLRNGERPDRQEFLDLAQAEASNKTEEFFANKAREYTQTKAFADGLEHSLLELLQIRPKAPGFGSRSALTNLAFDIAKENRPWQDLLLAQSYSFRDDPDSPLTLGFFESIKKDVLFTPAGDQSQSSGQMGGYLRPDSLRSVLDKQLSSGEGLVAGNERPRSGSLHVTAGHPSVAGALSTPTWMLRFRNTLTNKGRTRAAAVFRAFLCDPMKPIIIKDEKASRERVREFLSEKSDERVFLADHGKQDIHGTQPECMKCHYKLDPMGRVFANFSNAVPLRPLKGALVYKGSDGRDVNVPVIGLKELAQSIVEQKEFVSCQTKKFWQWYIGKDVELSEPRQRELDAKFRELGGRPQSFTQYLVGLPEFRQRPSAGFELPRPVSQVLNRCNSCHEMHPSSFNRLPFLDQASHAKVVGKIAEKLDLFAKGPRQPEMPPEWAGWSLSGAELEAVRTWILQGAPNSQGLRTLKPEAVSEIQGGRP